jgi:PAS domain-containing protein
MGDRKRCKRCGQVHERCTAHNAKGAPCGRRPATGTDVCRSHGGAAPQVIAAAERRRAEERARQAAARFALPIEIGPGEALLQEIHRTAGMVAWLEVRVEQVAGRSPEDLIFGTTKEQTRTSDEHGMVTTVEEAAAVHGWLKLWQTERKHLREVCRDALAAGIEERRVQLAEQHAAQIVTVLRGILADLGLTPDQQARVATVVPRHLRLVRQTA